MSLLCLKTPLKLGFGTGSVSMAENATVPLLEPNAVPSSFVRAFLNTSLSLAVPENAQNL